MTYRCPIDPEECPTSTSPGYCEIHTHRLELVPATVAAPPEPVPEPPMRPAAPAPPSLRLRVLGRTVAIPPSGELLVGRDEPAFVDLPGMASQVFVGRRQHARLYVDVAGTWVSDTGSRNGTYLDGARVERPMRMRPGQTLSFGRPPAGLAAVVESSAGEEIDLDEFGLPR